MNPARLIGNKQLDVYQTYAANKALPSEAHTFQGYIIQSSDQGEAQVTGDLTAQNDGMPYYDVPLCLEIPPNSGMTMLQIAKSAATNVGLDPSKVIGPAGDVVHVPVQVSNGSIVGFVNDLYAPVNGWATFDNEGNLQIIIIRDPRTVPNVRVYDGDVGDWDWNTFKETPPPTAPTVVFANALFPIGSLPAPITSTDIQTSIDGFGNTTITTTIITTVNGRETEYFQSTVGPASAIPVRDERLDPVSNGTTGGANLYRYNGGSAPTPKTGSAELSRISRLTIYDQYGNVVSQHTESSSISAQRHAGWYGLSTDLAQVNGTYQRAPFPSAPGSGASNLYSDGKIYSSAPTLTITSVVDVAVTYRTVGNVLYYTTATTTQEFNTPLAGQPPILAGFLSLQDQTGDSGKLAAYLSGDVTDYGGGGSSDFNSIYFDFGGGDWRSAAVESFGEITVENSTQVISNGYVNQTIDTINGYLALSGQINIGYLYKDGTWRATPTQAFGDMSSNVVIYRQLANGRFTSDGSTVDLSTGAKTLDFNDNASPPAPVYQQSALTSYQTAPQYIAKKILGTADDFVQTRDILTNSASSSSGGLSLSLAYVENNRQLSAVINLSVQRACAIRRQITRADDPYLKIGDCIILNSTSRGLLMRPHIVMATQRQFDTNTGSAIMAITAEDWIL